MAPSVHSPSCFSTSSPPLLIRLLSFQGEGEGDEGGWYYHNAIRTEEGLFHPECHKDKDNGMDASNVDTSMEENSSPVKKEMEVEEEKEDVHKASNDETTNELASPALTEESVIKTEPPAEQSNDDLDVPMEEVSAQDNEASVAVKEEHEKEETDANDNNLDSKENVAIKEEEEVTKSDEVMETETNAEEQSEELVDSEEVLKHSDSLLEETEKEPLAVPVVPAKVANTCISPCVLNQRVSHPNPITHDMTIYRVVFFTGPS